jgi:hypothetical protein
MIKNIIYKLSRSSSNLSSMAFFQRHKVTGSIAFTTAVMAFGSAGLVIPANLSLLICIFARHVNRGLAGDRFNHFIISPTNNPRITSMLLTAPRKDQAAMNLMPPTASHRKGRRTDRRVRDEALHLPRVSFFQSTPPETFNRLTSKPIGISTLRTYVSQLLPTIRTTTTMCSTPPT